MPHPVLDRGLDPRVERVEPIERERLGQCEPPARERVGAVVREHAVTEREPARVVEPGLLRGRSSIIRSPSSTWPSSRPSSLSPTSAPSVSSRVRAEVVEQRRGQQQVLVQALVQRARLDRERRHGDRVLEQAAEVGVVLPARGG